MKFIDKEKWDNYWYYNTGKTIAAVFVIIALISFVSSSLGSKKTILSVQVFAASADQNKAETAQKAFTSYFTKNPKESVNFNVITLEQSKQYAYSEKIVALLAAKEMDVIITDRTLFTSYASSGTFKNLSDIPEIKALADKSTLKLVQADYKDKDNVVTGNSGIDIEDCQVLKDAGLDTKNLVLGIPANTTRIDNAIKFIKYIYGQK